MGRRSRFRPIRQRIEAGALAGLGALARRIPFGWASALGGGIGLAAFGLLRRRRRIAEENVARALGGGPDDRSRRRLARRAFIQLGRSFMEFLALPGLAPNERLSLVALENAEPILRRQREGGGVILVTGHFGNWELLGAAVQASGVRLRYLLPAQTNSRSDAYLDGVRRALGIEPVKIGFGMREALRALRTGSCVGLLADQDARRVGIHVPFFGRAASTHAGPARLAYRSGCPIGVGWIVREAPERHRARFAPLLVPDRSRPEAEEVLRLTGEITARLEEAIRATPDHWYWLHRRWKTPPSDRPGDPTPGVPRKS